MRSGVRSAAGVPACSDERIRCALRATGADRRLGSALGLSTCRPGLGRAEQVHGSGGDLQHEEHVELSTSG